MASKRKITFEIDIRDLMFVVLKKIGIILLSGIVISCALFFYKYNSSVSAANTLNAEVKLNGETEFDYLKRVRNINRAIDIFESIDKLNEQVDVQRAYVSDSIIMRIDATNEAVTTAQFVFTINKNYTAGIDNALVSSYSTYLISGSYLEDLANDLGTRQEYLNELIKVDYSENSSVIFNTEGSLGCTGNVTITVIGPSFDYTDKVMDCIIGELDARHNELDSSLISHSISMVGRQNSYMLDNHTRDLQYNAANRFEVIQKQIDSYNDSLDKLASALGVKNRDNLYNYFHNIDSKVDASNVARYKAVKSAVIGFVVVVFFMFLFITINYVFGKKFITQTSFFDRFQDVRKIGVVKPERKRSAYSVLIDRKTGDDNDLSDEINIKLLAANIKNLTSGMNKILVTGTADPKIVKDVVSKLNLKFEVKDSFYVDPSCLESLSDYDGVILVEQRSYSLNKNVSEELDYIRNADTELIGAIIV